MQKIFSYLLTLLLLIAPYSPSDAAIFNGSTVTATPPAPEPSQPAAAITWGYNTRTFFDNFNSLSTIDKDNSMVPGYNWYMQSLVLGSYPDNYKLIFAPSSVQVSGGVLKYTPNTPAHDTVSGGNIYSAGWTGSGFVGNTIAPTGFYAEARISYDPSLSTAGRTWFPAFWMWDKSLYLQSAANNPGFSGNRYTEFDIFEAASGAGTITPHYGEFDWTSLSTAIANTNISLGVPTVDKNFHTYGILWIPMAKNGGTGLIQRWIDGVHIPGGDVTYSSSTISPQAGAGATVGWMSGADASTQGFTVQLQTAEGWPMYVDWVQVWQ